MSLYRIFKRDKFLEASSSFLIVSYFSNAQSNFVNFKDFLHLNKLKAKVIKSKSVNSCLTNYIPQDLLKPVKVVASCPVFLIKPNKFGAPFLDHLAGLNLKGFSENNMSILLCFNKGKIHNPLNFIEIERNKIHFNLIKNLSTLSISIFTFFNIFEILLIKILLLYINNQNDATRN